MKRLKALPLACAIASCAHNNTGHIDYRVADPPRSIVDRASGDEKPELADHTCPKKAATHCDPIIPARIVRRYMPPQAEGWDAIKPNRVFSIEIEQGGVGNNISEGHFLSEQLGKHAEIAILANVFEFAANKDDAAKKRFIENAGSDDPSDVELKLIYFGKGIERKQAFNFSNIPLMKRSKYGGGSIGIQIVVMEVDARSGPFSSLLQTLARFGQQLAPGPTEAKDLIFDLGESLLSGGSKDDKLFDYRFVLSAEGTDSRAMQATFAPGRYVLRRTENLTDSASWDKLRLDYNTGRLLKKSDTTSSWEEYRDDLYLTLNIRSYPIGTAEEFYEQRDWSEFRKALQLAADARATNLGQVTADVQGMLESRRSNDWGDRLLRGWATAQNRLEVYGSRYSKSFTDLPVPTVPPSSDPAPCTASRVELQRRHDIAMREAQDALRTFKVLYQLALKAKVIDPKTGQPKLEDGKPVDEFRIADREALVSAMAPYFMPWTTTKAASASFADASAFEAAFVSAGAGSLETVAMTAAANKAEEAMLDTTGTSVPKTCEALLSR